MPKTVEEIVKELNDMLRRKGGEVMTIPWPEFYTLGEIERFKEGRANGIQSKARSQFGLIVHYGQAVVLVAHDRNFAPAV